jgi:hypothetical protein
MRLTRTENVERVPGDPRAINRSSAEWICPDCDYFEEADEERS